MNTNTSTHWLRRVAFGALLLGVGAGAGYWWAAQRAHAPHQESPAPSGETPARSTSAERKVLYWYDPMFPTQKFDKPGKSPFMDMELVPKYADADAESGAVSIDPTVVQNLGVRLATVRRAASGSTIEAWAVAAFNDRDVSILQTRTSGFVERVTPLAPGDVVRAGTTIAELLVPEWAALQHEFLALRSLPDAGLADAARERLRLAGMPESLIAEIDATGRPRTRITITAPTGGVIQELGVRTGMTLMSGQTLARINGLGTIWLDVAVPESEAAGVRTGQPAQARFVAYPGEVFRGRITTVLPTLDEATRTMRVRVELPNPNARLRPGQSAQVSLRSADGGPALRVPTEAVIRTGRRALVLVAEDRGRFRPVEVTLGREVGDETIVLSGLAEGQQVVASGQFLIDSEANLRGLGPGAAVGASTSGSGPSATAADRQATLAREPLHEADATVREIGAKAATLAHGPMRTLGMPAMTMEFPLARPELAKGLKPGDRVRFAVRQTDDGLVVERIERSGSQP